MIHTRRRTLADMEENSRTPLAVTLAEAAKSLGVGRSKMYDLAAAGKIRTFKIGRCRRIPMAEIERIVEEGIS